MSSHPTDAAFARTVEALVNGCRGAEGEARRIVIALGLPVGQVRRFDRELDTLFVVRLLQERVPRADIRDRLVARGWSRRGAYRVIERALCRRGPFTSTQPGDDRVIETS